MEVVDKIAAVAAVAAAATKEVVVIILLPMLLLLGTLLTLFRFLNPATAASSSFSTTADYDCSLPKTADESLSRELERERDEIGVGER